MDFCPRVLSRRCAKESDKDINSRTCQHYFDWMVTLHNGSQNSKLPLLAIPPRQKFIDTEAVYLVRGVDSIEAGSTISLGKVHLSKTIPPSFFESIRSNMPDEALGFFLRNVSEIYIKGKMMGHSRFDYPWNVYLNREGVSVQKFTYRQLRDGQLSNTNPMVVQAQREGWEGVLVITTPSSTMTARLRKYDVIDPLNLEFMRRK